MYPNYFREIHHYYESEIPTGASKFGLKFYTDSVEKYPDFSLSIYFKVS